MIGFLQPGQGLGFTGSRQMAFGLGLTLLVVIIVGKSKGRDYQFVYESKDLQMALDDDRDFMEIIIMVVDAGLLD